MSPAPQRRRRSFLVVFGAWTLVGLFYLSQEAGRRTFLGDPRPWQEASYWAVRVYVSAAFTPLILWLGRRWPIERPHLASRSLGILLAGAAYAVCEVAVETAVLFSIGNPARGTLSNSASSGESVGDVTWFNWSIGEVALVGRSGDTQSGMQRHSVVVTPQGDAPKYLFRGVCQA
jgi:hypothetical protein